MTQIFIVLGYGVDPDTPNDEMEEAIRGVFSTIEKADAFIRERRERRSDPRRLLR